MATQEHSHVDVFRITKADLIEYVKRGPAYHQEQMNEFLSDIAALVRAMGTLAGQIPVTMMIGKIGINVTVTSGDEKIAEYVMGGYTDDKGKKASD